MSASKFMKSGGWAAIAVALAASAIPAEASAQSRVERMTQERDGPRASGDQQPNAMEIRGRRVQESNAARTRQAEPQGNRQVERPSNQTVAQADRRANWQGNRQVDRSGDQASRQSEQRGNWQGNRQTDRRGDQTARQTQQRADQAARQVEQRRVGQAQQAERNRSYADQTRNRGYANRTGDGRSDGNWQRDRRDNDRNGSNGRDWQNGRRDGDRNNTGQNDRRDNDRNWQSGRRDNDWNNRNWDRRWRDNDRYDWQRYRNTNRTVFRLGSYYAPYRGYSYSRFGVGSHIGSPFYGSSYWISNPWQYRLPDVWGPYRWVRYYDDVMLVDIYTGQVVDVIYNFFW